MIPARVEAGAALPTGAPPRERTTSARRGAGAELLATLLVASALLACDPTNPPSDGGADAGDAELPSVDGGTDASVMPTDGGPAVDAASPDDGGASLDAATAPDSSFCFCEAPAECTSTTCDGASCIYFPAADGTPCGPIGERRCVAGACSYGVCGDDYREGGPTPVREGCDDGNTGGGDACASDCTPTVLTVASREMGTDVPGRLAVAEDDAGDLLFVWAAEVGSAVHLRARRMSAGGVPIDAHDAPLLLDDTLGIGWAPESVVVGLSTGWVVAWTSPTADGDDAGIRYRIVRTDGSMSGPRAANQEVRGAQHQPAIARLSAGFLLAWTDASGLATPPGEARVMYRPFDASGWAASDESALSSDGSSARQPVMASDGVRVLAVWTQDAADSFGQPQIHGRRLGASPDSSSFQVSIDDGAEPSVATLPTGDFGVAWVGRSDDFRGDVRVRRLNASGGPLVGTSVSTLTATTDPHAELAPSVSGVVLDELIVAYEDGGSRRGLAFVQLGTSSLAPETIDVAAHIAEGLQGDVTLARTRRGLWFVWSDAGSLGHPDAYRSVLAYLLPID